MNYMRRLVLILLLLVFVLGGTTYYFYKNSKLYKVDPKVAEETEAKALAKKIGEFFVLPEGEVPTLATVTDLEALKGQAFFTEAKKGYKVLIYTNAKKAILYDPISGKVVNYAPINVSSQNQASPKAPAENVPEVN
jgi:hypothetical protein